MDSNNKHLEELATIRSLMEKSSRFLSLSGLSGVFAGTFAIFGALNVWLYTRVGEVKYDEFYNGIGEYSEMPILRFLVLNALIVLVLALLSGWYFSKRKAEKMGIPLWNSASRRMLINLFIPIVTGGIFCIVLLFRMELNLIVPLMLVFYGLGLINAGKYTEYTINLLGIAQIITGIFALYFDNQSLLFWTLGFGVWHIVYGIFMYYQHKKAWF